STTGNSDWVIAVSLVTPFVLAILISVWLCCCSCQGCCTCCERDTKTMLTTAPVEENV
ncbi:hypothetical protein NDU88_000871, partial [Pleurodeles waltl]